MSTRREFLKVGLGATAASLACGGLNLSARQAPPEKVSFFFVSDTHYLAVKDSPTEFAPESADVTGRLIDTLNRLPGEQIPESAGGGEVLTPLGVIHGGDLVDSADKQGAVFQKMQQTEWQAFVADYGLTGADGRLKYPVYEVHGNHDGPQGVGFVVDGIRERNKRRQGVTAISDNGLHYAWKWGPAHFINLGIVVGRTSDQPRKRRYDPHNSLEFLRDYLHTEVGASNRPVVLTHHVDVARYAKPCDASLPYSNQEWDPCDVAAYYETISKYNIAAAFYGHTHVRQVHTWDGASVQAKQGISLFNADNAGHFHSDTQAIFYVELADQELVVREYLTKDRWKTGQWSAVWRKALVS